MRQTKALKVITPIASAYGLEFAGVTRKGHYRWVHPPTGRSYVSVSDTTSPHSLKNTERDMKRAVQEFNSGQHNHPH